MMTLDKFFRAKKLAATSEATYRFALERFDAWLERQEIDIASLTPSEFDAFLASQTTWNHNSRYSAYCAIRSYIRWSYGNSHPALRYRLQRQPTEPQPSLGEQQLHRLFEYLSQRNTPTAIRDSALIAVMVDTGLRAAEICRLQVRHLHLDENACDAYVKGGRWERAVFSDATNGYLRVWMTTRDTVLNNLAVSDPGTVFISIRGSIPGTPMTVGGLRSNLYALGRRAGIGKFSPHDLRRTFATLSLKNGANTRLVQVAGRWRDIRLVERYSPRIEARDMSPYFPMNKINCLADSL